MNNGGPTDTSDELTECPNCGELEWNDVPNGYQCAACGYLDT